MSNATKEQQAAIDARGTNVIVSAGAGSGKTFVLKERVLKLLQNKEATVDKLIILTFTNKAAQEMKNRIRKVVTSHSELSDQIPLVDSSSITTFDAYAAKLVKKYSYLLGIDKNYLNADTTLIKKEIKSILDEYFEELYLKNDPDFINLINSQCYKNDEGLKSSIISLYYQINNITNKDNFLDTYVDTYFSESYITDLISKYNDYVFSKIDELAPLYSELEEYTSKEEVRLINNEHTSLVLNASTIEELNEAFNTELKRASRGTYDEGYKEVKDKIKVLEDEVKELVLKSTKTLKNEYMCTKESVIGLIKVLKYVIEKINEYKKEHNCYEFSDIAYFATKLVSEHEDVRNEIKNNTYEIMIDEYQDTNDIQENFINLIANNNVYMVGDVKQSIYRFRNANPYIFKTKYDNYKQGKNGLCIDLTKNFRSRKEVIDNINSMFNTIMFDNIGGANYKEYHQMGYGQTKYDSYTNDNYDMEVLNYTKDKDNKNIKREEIEAFLIAKDIQNKINNKVKVFHEANDEFVLEDINYNDFCILIDKAKYFDLFKTILESKGIPVTICKDISITKDDEMFIIKNLLTLLDHIKSNIIDTDFKHAYMSIARSYIAKTNDNTLFDIFNNNIFKDTELYKKLETITPLIDSTSIKELVNILINEFDIINKTILVGNVDERIKRLESIQNLVNDLSKLGYSLSDVVAYLNNLIDNDEDINIKINDDIPNAVRIMTIHASKGLEFNYVYLPMLNSNFNIRTNNNIMIDSEYGLMLLHNDNNIVNHLFTEKLYKNRELVETISEKIRLLYVAITRAREKFIMVNEWNEQIQNTDNITEYDLLNISSYSDILSLLKNQLSKYTTNINIDDLHIDKSYMITNKENYLSSINNTNQVLNINELNINYELKESKHFSKSLKKVIDEELLEKLDYGTHMHYLFEVIDFKNPNYDDLTNEEIDAINYFLNNDIVKDIKNANIYKEHEILFNLDNNEYHGFIDLLLEYPDHFDIIDYKLSNLDSEEYKIQLNGYRKYIENKYNLPCNMYLYSINKHVFKVVDKIN